jgi:DNA processing protein
MGEAPSETEAVLALVAATAGEWHRTAELIDQAQSALRLLRRDWPMMAAADRSLAETLVARVTPSTLDDARQRLGVVRAAGVQVLTVLDDGYPVNLRGIYNRPPVLYVRGALETDDARALAVVGTRDPSDEGLRQTTVLSNQLARRGITVISGLAQGIDSAAHEAALAAGGRTIAVMGTGINRIYPRQNEGLARRITAHGALVSQFWPDAPPTRASFPLRNVVTSGMALGTVVIEATARSGARMQARLALEHGKRLFLLESLVADQKWARKYAERPGTTVVKSAGDIVDVLDRLTEPVQQLSFS